MTTPNESLQFPSGGRWDVADAAGNEATHSAANGATNGAADDSADAVAGDSHLRPVRGQRESRLSHVPHAPYADLLHVTALESEPADSAPAVTPALTASATVTAADATPCILLTATLRWPIAARLAVSFAELGCRVDVVCPPQHPATHVRAVRRTYSYSTLRPLVSLRAAIAAAAPDLVIPCDDNAAIHLHRLYAQTGEDEWSADAPAGGLRRLIARSLGVPAACSLATARGRLLALAAEEEVRIPESSIVDTPRELNAWLRFRTFPAVMKIDCTWGGQGVTIVHNHEQAHRVFAVMATRPALANALARALLDRDLSVLLSALSTPRRTVTLQEFVPGVPANRAVACWQGQVLAGTSVAAIRTQHATGPATVVRVIDNDEMSVAVERLVRRLGISGLWGVDFVLEQRTGSAHLIEVNPRATPICHLPVAAGKNLVAALYKQLTGELPQTMPTRIEHDQIALFPGEWRRDPASPFLLSGYHDVPWDEPDLIADCIERPWAERGAIARMWAHVQPKVARLRARPSDTEIIGRDLADFAAEGAEVKPLARTGAAVNGVAVDATLNGATLHGAIVKGAALNGAALNGAAINGAAINGAGAVSADGSGSSLTLVPAATHAEAFGGRSDAVIGPGTVGAPMAAGPTLVVVQKAPQPGLGVPGPLLPGPLLPDPLLPGPLTMETINRLSSST